MTDLRKEINNYNKKVKFINNNYEILITAKRYGMISEPYEYISKEDFISEYLQKNCNLSEMQLEDLIVEFGDYTLGIKGEDE